MKKIIFYELNEVPPRIIDRYCELRPRSSIRKMVDAGRTYKTVNKDVGHLSPWITWPTLHRGVNNDRHRISDFGQDVSEVNASHPNYFDIVADSGASVGVFGSLHTYPLPHKLSSYSFYVPDTFANGPETHPPRYQAFQALNLYLTRRNGRNVSRKVPILEAARFLAASPSLGLSGRTVYKLCSQVASETANRSRVVRRRTSQAQIAFDLFMQALERTKPDLSTFFTNHVASSMHRYWPATFPDDYSTFRMPERWRETFREEIWFTLDEADAQLTRLLAFTDKNPDYAILVASSMGQAAVDGVQKLESQLLLTAPKALMDRVGLQPQIWQQKLAMAPQYVFEFGSTDALAHFVEELRHVTICGTPPEVVVVDPRTVRVSFGQGNFSMEKDEILYRGSRLQPGGLGLEVVPIQDETGSYAYHIPEGILIVYGGGSAPNGVEAVDTTEVAPAILKNFGISPREYMKPTSLTI